MVIIDYDQQQHLVQQHQQQSVFRVNHILDPEVIIYVPRLHINIYQVIVRQHQVIANPASLENWKIGKLKQKILTKFAYSISLGLANGKQAVSFD